ncbi:hypothetical protein [Photorhabdus laumondii]|uniref:hypothetical protein n=1 Tax=Photorhabdus laumondii TaxID=2218628 RepID=UPI003314F74C
MKYLKSFAALVLSIPMMVFSTSPIICENESPGNTITSIWPSIYLSGQNFPVQIALKTVKTRNGLF